jgi:GTP diphosphokinase / guanosine-3',5'-bis(diphosphate) 3'-diphosphatase
MQYKLMNPDNLLAEIKYLDRNYDLELIGRALTYADEAHKMQTRRSGEIYITHPVNVAFILAQLKMDSKVIAAGLLHDILEDTSVRKEELIERFGKEIADLVDGLTKLESYTYKSITHQQQMQADNFRKLLISITKDVRIIIIKLADRLHNMRTLHFLPDIKKKRIAQETLDIYVPLANRFGIAVIQWELEDLCLKYLYPEDYQKIVELLALKKIEREKYISSIVSETEQILKENDIAAEVSGRSKHLFSIWRKGRIKKLKFEEILDLIGIRIIVDSVENCYKVLGLMQLRYIQLAKGLKDYIAQPKENGYQSLHLNVVNEDGRSIEIQIRTKEMHLIAEEGIAAHWHYKEEYGMQKKDRSGKPYTAIDDSVKKNVIWIRDFLKEQKQENPELFLKSLKLNLYPDIIVVRTPENKYIKLNKNSTPLDFAFKLHTDIGLHCIGAHINGKHKPVRTILKNGDVVKVLTSPQAKPSKDWITILTSVKARQKVRQYFRNIEIQELVEQGKEIFYKRIRKLPVKVKSDAEILALAKQFKLSDAKSFFARLGSGEIDFQEIKQVLLPEEKDNVITEEESDNNLPTGDISMPAILLENIDNLMIRFAKCCDPQPGDKIVGYTTRGKGITIHKDSCSNKGFTNLRKKEPERILPVKWKKGTKRPEKDSVLKKQHKNH